MSPRTTIIIFSVVFLIAIFFVVILPFFFIEGPPASSKKVAPPPPSQASKSKAEADLTDQGVFRSDDGGITWHQKAFVEGSSASIAGFKINRIIQDPSDSQTLYLLTNGDGLWVSRSQGDLWAKVIDPAGMLDPSANVLGLAVNPAAPNEWYVASFQKNRGVLLVTTDGGKTFRQTYFMPLEGYGIFDVAFDPGRNTASIVTGQGGFLQTTNRGITWRVVRWFRDGLIQLLVDPVHPAVQYVVSSRGSLFRTEDYGASWLDVTEGIRQFSGSTLDQQWVIDQAGAMYLGSDHGLLRSRDRALTYTEPELIVPTSALPLLSVAVDPKDASRIFVSFANQLYATRDDGATWSILAPPSTKRITHLYFDRGDSKIIYATVAP